MIKPASTFSVAPFRFDITPPLNHALLGGLVMPAVALDDALEGIGYVLLGAEAPIVVCVLDWAGLLNTAHLSWRIALAEAAHTTPDRVALQCVHQHNTPFVCPDASAAAAGHRDLPPMFDVAFVESCRQRACAAVRTALRTPQRVTHIAHGRTTVRQVASNRRVARDEAGRVLAMRKSSCNEPDLIALPEGVIDPWLQTAALYNAQGRKIVACHYYATHPMSYYRDGHVTSDFCGLARKRRQAEEPGCTHLYFTGCSGDVAAGKYNDGTPARRIELTERIHSAIVASEATLVPEPLTQVDWRFVPVLPAPRATPTIGELEAAIGDRRSDPIDRLLHAFQLGWVRRIARGVPLELSCLRLNHVSILHLPGEMFVAYQLRARAMRPDEPVLVAAYGDDGPWYIPTREEYPAGGYEVSAAFCGDEVDAMITDAIRSLLA